MAPIVTLLVVLVISLVLTRVAAVALTLTGLGREAARFQARSAFTGVGFTTSESENIVGHPIRRRVVMMLMLVGNVGIVSVMSTLVLSFIELDRAAPIAGLHPLLWLIIGLALLLGLATSAWLGRGMERVIAWALMRFGDFDARDYARLLHVQEDFGVTELAVRDADWLAGRTLREARLADEGIVVLGIECPGGTYIGSPCPDTELRCGDTLLVYGRTGRVADVARRRVGSDGDAEHADRAAEERSAAPPDPSRVRQPGSAGPALSPSPPPSRPSG